MKLTRLILFIVIGFFAVQAFVWLVFMIAAISRDTGNQDVTRDPSFGSFAAVVGNWKSKVPLRLIEIKHVLYLDCGDVEPDDLALLPVGTEIRIEQLVYRETFETNYLDAWGSLTVGPCVGKRIHIDNRLFARDLVFRVSLHHGQEEIKKTTWSVADDKLTK
jgi:hypothetical protein